MHNLLLSDCCKETDKKNDAISVVWVHQKMSTEAKAKQLFQTGNCSLGNWPFTPTASLQNC